MRHASSPSFFQFYKWLFMNSATSQVSLQPLALLPGSDRPTRSNSTFRSNTIHGVDAGTIVDAGLGALFEQPLPHRPILLTWRNQDLFVSYLTITLVLIASHIVFTGLPLLSRIIEHLTQIVHNQISLAISIYCMLIPDSTKKLLHHIHLSCFAWLCV